MKNISKKILFILTVGVLITGCDSNTSSKNEDSSKQLLALANIVKGNPDAQTDDVANQLNRNFMGIDESFNEDTERKNQILEFANKVLKVNESGKITLDGQTKNCPNGGTVTVSGELDLKIISLTDTYNKEFEISNSTRNASFQNCSMKDGMKIISGTMKLTQSGTAKVTLSKNGSTLFEKVESNSINRVGELKMQRTMNGRTGDVSVKTNIKVTQDLIRMSYTLDDSNTFKEPKLLEIKGNVSGTANINTPRGERTRNISRTLNKKFD